MLLTRDPETVARLVAIPGARRVAPDTVEAPIDVAVLFGAIFSEPADVRQAITQLEDASALGHLRTSQLEDVRQAIGRQGLILGHPCSGGKTLSAIATAHVAGFPALVTGPALARGVWESEVAKWARGARFVHLRGRTPAPTTLQGLQDGSPVFVFVNYEVLGSWGSMLAQVAWKTVIMDEQHELRGRRAERVTRGLRRALMFSQPLRLGLTATPVWSRVDGLWTLLDLIHPGWFGTYHQFTSRYAGAYDNGLGWRLGMATELEELHARLDYTIRRIPKEELLKELPALRRVPVYLENPTAARRLAETAKSLVALRPLQNGQDRVQRILMSALQRETHAKLGALKTLVESRPDRRFLVVTQLRESAAKVADALATVLPLSKLWCFDGADTMATRRAAIDAASRTEPPAAVVCTMASVRQSIDASGLDTGVVVELPWTVEEAIQFEGRLHRIDQSREVEIYYVTIDNSLDRHCLELLSQKLDTRTTLVGGDAGEADLAGMLRGADLNLTRARLIADAQRAPARLIADAQRAPAGGEEP